MRTHRTLHYVFTTPFFQRAHLSLLIFLTALWGSIQTSWTKCGELIARLHSECQVTTWKFSIPINYNVWILTSFIFCLSFKWRAKVTYTIAFILISQHPCHCQADSIEKCLTGTRSLRTLNAEWGFEPWSLILTIVWYWFSMQNADSLLTEVIVLSRGWVSSPRLKCKDSQTSISEDACIQTSQLI